ncbi:unnamed protein product [Euphydryas editha]|uniref:Uncharacterized protein n=1 Tax=Euphydryas editha TaxID=104508 RepID=A0AAU9VCD6_EUPED|nr:unnamed protein product [Euphydryas editha]
MIHEELQEAYNLFIDEINKAAGKSIPYVKISQDPCSKFTPRPYWNTKLSKAIAERQLALLKEKLVKHKELVVRPRVKDG